MSEPAGQAPGGEGPHAIRVDRLVKAFGEQRALDDVSFTASVGEVLGLLGPNGAGKTTIINILSTLLAPDGGAASVFGHDVADDAAAVRRSIALTGQFAALDDMLTGRENLVLFGRLRGLTSDRAAHRADELLDRFSLADAAGKAAGSYSGGMRRRLDLAASLVVAPKVLFLDEPTTGLDPRSRNELWQVVRELRSDGLTIVLTTQYLDEADQLADRIVVIDDGRLVAEGTPDELKSRAGSSACVLTPEDPADLARLHDAIDALGPAAIDAELMTVTLADASPRRMAEAFAAADAQHIEVADVLLRRPTLDEVFLQLTGAAPGATVGPDGPDGLAQQGAR